MTKNIFFEDCIHSYVVEEVGSFGGGRPSHYFEEPIMKPTQKRKREHRGILLQFVKKTIVSIFTLHNSCDEINYSFPTKIELLQFALVYHLREKLRPQDCQY